MICVSIKNKTREQILEILDKVEMAEIRLDLCNLSDEDIEEIFSSDTPLIATYRIAEASDAASLRESERQLSVAVKAGARYLDLDIDTPTPTVKRLRALCNEWGTALIRSYHNASGTPSVDELRTIVDRCRHYGGEVVKVVTTPAGDADVDAVLGLYKYYTPEILVAFAMGEKGRRSRIECLAKGAPFSYACLDVDDATAEGQYPYEEMHSLVYGQHKFLDAGAPIRMPASKSYAQRAIVAAALADGESTLKGYSPCDDSEAALNVARSLGAEVVKEDDSTIKIKGIAASPACLDGGRKIEVGESGLLARLMLPLGAQLTDGSCTVEGCGTLLKRPLDGVEASMQAMGADVEGSSECLPLTVCGQLCGGKIEVEGSKTSQLVSGALMALPLGPRNCALSVHNPTSIPYIYMTMDILRTFGVKVRSEMYGGRKILQDDWSACTEMLLKMKENQAYKAAEIEIEGDWSAASAFLAAGAIFGQVAVDGLDTSSLQADLCMLDILMDAGASMSQLDTPKGTVVARKSPLCAIEEDLSNSPDLFPVVAVLCCFAQGRSVLRGVHRLAHKESDRAEGIVNMLRGFGVQISVKNDEMIIQGESLCSRILNGRLLRGGKFSACSDHRMVMALSLAALGADSPVEIDDTSCVAKSFPNFLQSFGSATDKCRSTPERV